MSASPLVCGRASMAIVRWIRLQKIQRRGDAMRLVKLMVVCLLAVVSSSVMATETPSKQDFVSALESYHYSSITLEKVRQVGCEKFVQGFPVGFTLVASNAEILVNIPEGLQNKTSSFLADPKFNQMIFQQLSWMDQYRKSRSVTEFQAMCADFGGKQVMEWLHFRKEFFRLAVIFTNK